MILRIIFAHIFRILFKLPFLRKHFFGIHQKWFRRFNWFKGLVVKRKLYGNLIFELKIDDWIQENLFFLDTYEDTEITLFKKLISNKSCFMDIGANIGLYSLNASQVMSPNAKIYAFEPFLTNNKTLQKNILLNNIKNIQVEKKAISNNVDKIKLYYDKNEKNLGTVSLIEQSNLIPETVDTITLDIFVKQNNIQKIDFIKMDIEGAEFLALQGMKSVLKNFKPQILIELDPDILSKLGENSTKIENYLQGFGYKKYFIDINGGLKRKQTSHKSNNYIFSCH